MITTIDTKRFLDFIDRCSVYPTDISDIKCLIRYYNNEDLINIILYLENVIEQMKKQFNSTENMVEIKIKITNIEITIKLCRKFLCAGINNNMDYNYGTI